MIIMKNKQKTRMNKVVLNIVIVFLTAAVFSMTGCGKADPKLLAKECYEEWKETSKLYMKGPVDPNDPRVKAYEKKYNEIEAKVSKMSEEDQKIYNEEFVRLTKQKK
jgi:hypothetical protein